MSRGYFGIGIYNTKSVENIGTLWRHAHIFDAGFIFTIGKRYKRQASDTNNTASHVPLFDYLNYDDFYSNIPYGCEVIGVEKDLGWNTTPLPHFTHPQRCIYLLGAEDGGLPKKILDTVHDVVSIPTPQRWPMNVSVAGTMVMYDRFLKREKPVI